jgi:hypothetical protein
MSPADESHLPRHSAAGLWCQRGFVMLGKHLPLRRERHPAMSVPFA